MFVICEPVFAFPVTDLHAMLVLVNGYMPHFTGNVGIFRLFRKRVQVTPVAEGFCVKSRLS